MAIQKSDVEIGKRPLAREQVYLCIMTNTDKPPPDAPPRDQLRNAHREYLADLERRGILFGAGRLVNAAEDEHTALGWGMIILRAKTRAEAEAIAFEEPYTKAGHRTMVLHPWQRNEGNVNISIRFMDSVLEVDSRTYDIVPREE
jgi:uncharacterized protein YciI